MNDTHLVDQAERGVIEPVLPSYPASAYHEDAAKTAVNSMTDLKMDEKKRTSEADVKVTPVEEKQSPLTGKNDTSALPVVKKDAKPAKDSKPKPKRKRASKWIQFTLWYNTYRLVFAVYIFSIGLIRMFL